MEFLAQWGLELILGLVGTGITAYFTVKAKEWKAEKQRYETLLSEQQSREVETMMETKLEPIYEELEDLRAYIRDAKDIEKTHMSLIIASYRFRLIQLCKEFIRQGFMTEGQYEQLEEFYKVYAGLGGNGKAQNYYERAIALPIRDAAE